MTKNEFRFIRKRLGKSQRDMADLLGVSESAIRSFEQGWRDIPPYAERQTLFLALSLKTTPHRGQKNCWEVIKCPSVWREKCMAYNLDRCDLCWFVNGRVCQAKSRKNWGEKMKICRKCKFFRLTFSFLENADN